MKPVFLTLAALAALAQTGTGVRNEPDAKPAPVIPIELQMEYFRTDGVLAHLRADLDRAQGEYEAAVRAMVQACGEGSSPVLTADKKHLFCVAQAPASKK